MKEQNGQTWAGNVGCKLREAYRLASRSLSSVCLQAEKAEAAKAKAKPKAQLGAATARALSGICLQAVTVDEFEALQLQKSEDAGNLRCLVKSQYGV